MQYTGYDYLYEQSQPVVLKALSNDNCVLAK